MKSFFIALTLLGIASVYSQTPAAPPDQKAGVAAAAETVFILGEIRMPQVLAYTHGLTLSGAIGNAGGTSEWGATRIYIIRDGSIFLKTDTNKVSRAVAPEDPLLKPRDVVYLGLIANRQ